jgi:AraC-like DNA-binding protein
MCRTACREATRHAMTSGEPYFYRCWAHLLFVIIPVAPHNQCCGGITLGGFCATEESGEIRDNLLRIGNSWPRADLGLFLKAIPSLRQISASALRGMGTLALETSFSSGVNSSDFFRRQNEKYLQQRRIAEAFADIREQDPDPDDILGDTCRLIAFLNQNDKAGAMGFVDRYLAGQLMASNWDSSRLKARIRILLAVLTSHSILNGTPWAVATTREMRQMLRLENSTTTEDSCYAVAEWVHDFFEGQRTLPLQDRRPLGERISNWLQSHYQESVTLTGSARALGTSTSTLVHRLRRETGKTFKQFVVEIRLAEAKKLLATTSLELSAIGDLCGFFDQSHFTREFKRTINLTPGQFRKLLAVPDEALRQSGIQSLDETALLRNAVTELPARRPPARATHAPAAERAFRDRTVSSSRGPARGGRSGRESSRRPRTVPL